MTKRAICVGINDYSARSDCPSLGDARQDGEAFAALLPDAFGLDSADITLLTDGKATRQAVLAALGTMLKKSGAGDVACLFFAGHGGRGPAGDGSTYYESICCADAGGDITDTEINAMAAALEPSIVNFTLVLDSCHSGGVFDPPDPATRALKWSSDQADQFAQSCTAIIPHIVLSDVSGMTGNVGNISKGGNSRLSMTVNEDLNFSDNAKATLLAACRYDQNASSTGSHGYFTQSLLDIINQSGFQVAHPEFLSRMRQTIAGYTKKQTPQLRGRPIRLQENFLEGWNYSV
jgi:hypothetical protein